MAKEASNNRDIVMIIVIILISLTFVYRLMQLQIVHGETYRQQSERRLLSSKELKAPRGEIFDRFGRPLATNRMGFSVQVHRTDMPTQVFYQTLLRLYNTINEEKTVYVDQFPITMTIPFAFTFSDTSQEKSQAQAGVWKKNLSIDQEASALEVMEILKQRYNVADSYSMQEARKIIGMLEDMRVRRFSRNTPFTVATDVDKKIVMKLEEQHLSFPGVVVEVQPIRHYMNGEFAAHLLGRVGIIYAEEYQQLRDQEYGMNDMLGKDGMEKILEPYLKGVPGINRVEQNIEGQVTRVLARTPPTPGSSAVLTLDIELQKIAEKSLAANIERIRTEAQERIELDPQRRHIGEEASSGAAVVMDVNTGEILAMATYPTYNPARFKEDYAQLQNDPLRPMFNRAISGIYSPGSTFKALTGIAALEQGIVTPDEMITCRGLYRFYEDVGFTPRCWIYQARYGYQSHGSLNVSGALQHSCNYFFYDVGRRLTIQNINDYAKQFGLGELSGVELPGEARGILAGPEYRDRTGGGVWYHGETLIAAIGEMHAFTPIQLASYVSTLVNGGTRYRAHLIKQVKTYDYSENEVDVKPEILSQVQLDERNLEAILRGLHSVTEEGGTASRVFRDFPVIVGGKTGTAERQGVSDNGVFIGFAPYHNPQIAVAIVIEHGGSGGNTAPVARDIFAAHLNLEEDRHESDRLRINTLAP